MGLPLKEIDDGLTLLYLLGRSDMELLGVATTFGNGAIDKVYPQTERLLHEVGRADLPVFRGERGRGQPPPDAARFLAETVAAHAGEITLLATGPLGNLRAAAELDPAFFDNLKQIVCMGGTLRPLRIGWRNLPELNLSADPEAAFAVLNAPLRQSLSRAKPRDSGHRLPGHADERARLPAGVLRLARFEAGRALGPRHAPRCPWPRPPTCRSSPPLAQNGRCVPRSQVTWGSGWRPRSHRLSQMGQRLSS